MSEIKRDNVLVCAFACLRDPYKKFGFGKGGEGGLGWNVVLQLSRFHTVHVLTHPSNKEAIEKAQLHGALPNLYFYYIDVPDFLYVTKKIIQLYAYVWQIKAYLVAKKLHQKIHFDVFWHVTYANDWMASFIGALLPARYIRGPGGGAHHVPEKFVKEYSWRERLKQRIRRVGQWVFRHDPFFIIGQNRAKALLVCNQEAFDALPKKWQKKAYFFPVNGISKKDLGLLVSETKKNPSAVFSILTAGKLIKIKGFDLAIKAFQIFNQKVPMSELVIVGDGSELENLKKMVGRAGLEKKVHLREWMPREVLLQKMFGSDVFIFPSLRDGGGNVVVEAMAAGKPIICFDIAGPGFHVDQTCGIKIKPESPQQAVLDMAKALERLYMDKELRDRLGKGARERAEKVYHWDILGDRLFEIYKNTLK